MNDTNNNDDIIAVTGTGTIDKVSAKANAVQNFENTVLQKLDEWIPDQKSGSYYPAEVFEEDPAIWDGMPIVYAQAHPDPYKFNDDQEAALKSVKTFEGDPGRIIGTVRKPRVEGGPDNGGGQKRLMCDAKINDKEAGGHWEEGKLRISNAMFVKETKDKHVTKIVKASHALFFVDDGQVQQGDKGAIIMNTATLAVQAHTGVEMTKSNGSAPGPKSIVHAAIDKFKRSTDELLAALGSDKNGADEAKARVFADAKDYVPSNPPGYGKEAEDAEWQKPTLDDFTDKQWQELTDDEKRTVSSCYAYVGDLADYGSLQLPHHAPESNNVVWNGVRSAMAACMGARGGVDMGTRRDEVISHLVAHYRDFDKQSPFTWAMGERIFTSPDGPGETSMSELDELKSKVHSLETEAKTNSDAIRAKDSEVTALKNTVSDRDSTIKTLTAERDQAKTERDTLKTDLEKYKASEADAKFQAVLNTLPKGLYAKEEDKAALKDLWTKDPQKFFLDIAPKMNTVGKPSGITGDEHAVQNTKDMTQEEYMRSRKTIGGKDPATGKLAGEI